MPSSLGIGMHVEVRDPDDKTILSRVYSSEGRISFTSHTPGEHVICLYSNSTAWFSGTQLASENILQLLLIICKIFFIYLFNFREYTWIFKLVIMLLTTRTLHKRRNYRNCNSEFVNFLIKLNK